MIKKFKKYWMGKPEYIGAFPIREDIPIRYSYLSRVRRYLESVLDRLVKQPRFIFMTFEMDLKPKVLYKDLELRKFSPLDRAKERVNKSEEL